MTLSLGLTGNPYVGRLANRLRSVPQRLFPPLPPRTYELKKIPEPDPRQLVKDSFDLEEELRSHHRWGLATAAVTVAVVIVWAGIMPLAGAVVIGGTFVVHTSTKKIQHRTGGVVKEVFVHEGGKVRAGEKLAQLDDIEIQASHNALVRQMDEMQLRIARLNAEWRKADAMEKPRLRSPPEEQTKMFKAERDFFEARKKTQSGIQKLAVSRVEQLKKNIVGLEAQGRANKSQQKITAGELAGTQELFNKRIAPIQRLTPLQRENARLQGNEEQIAASIQEMTNKIEETKLQAAQSQEGFHEDVMRDLNEASAKNSLLLERFTAVNQELTNTTIYAPVSGTVNELTVHTVGGVLSPAESFMTIIPDDDQLEVAIRLPSDRIDQVHMDQPARVKLTAFERTIQDIDGSVNRISRDLVESKAGSYYDVRIGVDQHPHGLVLAPGMPAEVFIKTDERTMLSYLFKPLTEQMSRMFRER